MHTGEYGEEIPEAPYVLETVVTGYTQVIFFLVMSIFSD
jgi:hypothetical protein